jgi:hypothetical protein
MWKTARAIGTQILFLFLIVSPIVLIWGRDGRTIPNFVGWWCQFSGITNPAIVDTAIGVFAAMSLMAYIYFVWSLLQTAVEGP